MHSRTFELSDRQREAFVMAENHPLRSGLTLLVEHYKEMELVAVSDASLTPDQRQFVAGRSHLLVELGEVLNTLYQPIDKEGCSPL